MVYTVNLSTRAVRNIRSIYQFINAETSALAAKWFYGLEETVFSLDHHPQRGQPSQDNPLSGKSSTATNPTSIESSTRSTRPQT
jgi:plasmid stabilization system protein ParE